MGTPGLVLLALALLAPGALGAWGIQGSVEPDTPEDTGFQWQDAPTGALDGERRVYFNAIAVVGAQYVGPACNCFAAAFVNPNVALDGAQAPPAAIDVVAYLGEWKDCDRDGYVGHAQTAFWRYPTALLSDASLCPEGSRFHRDGWVTEFLWIGAPSPGASPARDQLVDPDSRVWGDFGRPGDAAAASCRVGRLPPGTLQSTGGAMRTVDCQLGHLVGRTLALADAETGLGLAPEDPYHPERDCAWVLHASVGLMHDANRCPQDPPGLFENTQGERAFTVWDCSRPKGTLDARDPTAAPGERGGLSGIYATLPTGQRVSVTITDESGTYSFGGVTAAVPALAPAVHDPHGSYNEAARHADDVVSGCRPTPDWAGLLNYADGRSLALESSEDSTAPGEPKRRVDFPMVYQPPADPATTAAGRVDPQAGLHHPLRAGSGWRSYGEWRMPLHYMGTLARSDLQPAEPVRLTFYAHLGAATLASLVAAGEPGTYGAEACGEHTSGLHGGWDCDADAWETFPRPPPGYTGPWPVGAVAGERYHLRDVDCLDGEVVRGSGVRAGTAGIGGDGCVRSVG